MEREQENRKSRGFSGQRTDSGTKVENDYEMDLRKK